MINVTALYSFCYIYAIHIKYEHIIQHPSSYSSIDRHNDKIIRNGRSFTVFVLKPDAI